LCINVANFRSAVASSDEFFWRALRAGNESERPARRIAREDREPQHISVRHVPVDTRTNGERPAPYKKTDNVERGIV